MASELSDSITPIGTAVGAAVGAGRGSTTNIANSDGFVEKRLELVLRLRIIWRGKERCQLPGRNIQRMGLLSVRQSLAISRDSESQRFGLDASEDGR